MSRLILLLPSTICIISAALMVYTDKTGWGWFLFVGYILGDIAYDKINVDDEPQ